MTISAGTFRFVADLVRRGSAIELTVGKEFLVESRLLPLVQQAGLSGVDEYVDTLRLVSHGAEHDRAVQALTTNETSWFRDVTPFQTLAEHVIPALHQDGSRLTVLRVWSAGCSSGQEPFSIAMALIEAAPGLAFEITATDLSLKVLSAGRAGRYRQSEVDRGLPEAMLQRHFTQVGTQWQLSQEVSSRVAFSQHNLLDPPPPPGRFDVIFVRNVLMYFDTETRSQVLRRVRAALEPGGFLVLGAVESTLGIEGAWERVPTGRGSVYQVAAGNKRSAD